jgi:spore coat protein U-like protein
MKSYKLASLVGSAMVACSIGSGAWAGTNTGSLSVTSSVAQSCIVSTTLALAFGAYDPIAASALPGTGSVSLKCTKGSSAITIDLDAGGHASGSQRRMLGGTSGDFLNYNVTQPATTTPWTSCAGSTVWGSTVGGSVYTPSGVTWSAAAAQAFTVCGSVPAVQNVSADGSYTDTVIVTVNF